MIEEWEGKRMVLMGVSLETRFNVKAVCLSKQYVVVVARPRNVDVGALASVGPISGLVLLLAGRRTLRNVVSQDATAMCSGDVLRNANVAELVPAGIFSHAADATQGLQVGSLVGQLLGNQEGKSSGRCPVVEAAHQPFLSHNEQILLIVSMELFSRDSILLHCDIRAAVLGSSNHSILVVIIAVDELCLTLALGEILVVVFHDDDVGIVSLVDHPSEEQSELEVLKEVLRLGRIKIGSCGCEADDVHPIWQLAVAIEEEAVSLVDDVEPAGLFRACLAQHWLPTRISLQLELMLLVEGAELDSLVAVVTDHFLHLLDALPLESQQVTIAVQHHDVSELMLQHAEQQTHDHRLASARRHLDQQASTVFGHVGHDHVVCDPCDGPLAVVDPPVADAVDLRIGIEHVLYVLQLREVLGQLDGLRLLRILM